LTDGRRSMRGSLNATLPYEAPRRLPPLQPALRPLPGVGAQRSTLHMVPLWAILIAGYSTFGRSFAYLGVPPVFIGELYIAWWMLFGPTNWLSEFVDDCLHFKLLPTMILLNIVWGLFDVIRPVLEGRPPFDAVRTFAFNYYPILLPIGIEIGRRITFGTFIKFWKNYSLYFVGYSVFLMVGGDNLALTLPWRADIPLFNVPAMAGFVGVGTLALWPHLERWKWRWIVLALSTVPVFTSPGRGTFLALILGLAIVGLWAPKRLVLIGCASIGILGLMFLLSTFMPAQKGRATTMDPIVNIARVRATFDPKGAYLMMLHDHYAQEAQNMLIAQGTAQWRETIWTNAIRSLNNGTLIFAGQGHGASVQSLTPDNQELHTPHNFVIYALYYTGAIGLTIFCLMILGLLLATQKVPEPTLRAMLLAQVLIMCLMAAVGNMFETPIAAVPFYLIAGIGLGIRDFSMPSLPGFPVIMPGQQWGSRIGNYQEPARA
jgi:O-Antigen ligase